MTGVQTCALPILKEKDIADNSSATGFWTEFLPEVNSFLGNINFQSYRKTYIVGFEKFLRRLRVLSLRIDSFTYNLIAKIKSSSQKNSEVEQSKPLNKGELNIKTEEEDSRPIIILSKEENLEQEEQELILRIARDPKNTKLYKKLGSIYLRLKNYDDAAESFKTALKLNPENEDLKLQFDKAERLARENKIEDN